MHYDSVPSSPFSSRKNDLAQSWEQNLCAYRLTAHLSHTGLKHSTHFNILSTLEVCLHWEQAVITAKEYIKQPVIE